MSECMTVDDTIQKENTDRIEVDSLSAAKNVVGDILEEALHSAVIDTDRGYMIGDFTEDFSQQFGQVSLSESTTSTLTEGQSSVSNNELQSDLQTDNKSEPLNSNSDSNKSDVKEYRVLDDQALEDHELRIENGLIRLEKNKTVKPVDELRNEYFSKEDIIKDEKIEIEYFNGGKLNKIYVPLTNETKDFGSDGTEMKEPGESNDGDPDSKNTASLAPISSEELRQSILQVWETVNPSIAERWDGDVVNQPEEVMKIMEKLSGLQVMQNDPNRPRAYTLAEEEVKRMVKEIEEINFNQCSVSTENSEVYNVTGQGDYETEADSRILYENLNESVDNSINELDNDNIEEPKDFLGVDSGFEENQTGMNNPIQVDVNLNESATLQSSFTLESYKTWVDDAEGFHIESEAVENRSSLGLDGAHFDPYCDENDPSQVFASQKFNETYDFGVNEGVIGIPLTMSDEDLINNSESVIQIIDPAEESPGEISFSLYNEMDLQDYYKHDELAECEYDYPLTMNSEKKIGGSDIMDPKRIRSGITTVGPMKNLDHDPRDLAGPEIDFGQMTIISGTHEMTRESDSNRKSSKNLITGESDEVYATEEDGRYVTVTGLVNHDIASVTRVQKIKEAISHQQRSVHDLSNDSQIGRGRLDLKNIESSSDSRYDDMSMPLISLEVDIGETNPTEIDILQEVPLAVHESRDNACYYAGNPSRNSDSSRNIHIHGRSSPLITGQTPDEKVLKAQSTKTILNSKNDESKILNLMDGTQKDMETRFSSNPEDRQEHVFHFNNNVQSDSVVNKKHNTLSNVFRKASNKFMRKDSDSFLRNAKSLPRDTSRLHFSLSGAESIKSLIDDCQSSAANVIKKSRSLLKNTQSLFKTISHTKFSDDSANIEKRKSTSCEIELNEAEGRPSTCSKKEDLTRSKSSIKNKIMKTFKSSDNLNSSPSSDNRDVPHEHKGLSLILKNCKDYRVEKIEKVRKLLPKSSLFSRSQTGSGSGNEVENEEADAGFEGETVIGESVDMSSQSSDQAIENITVEEEIADTNYTSCIGDRGDVQLPVIRLSDEASLEEDSADWVEEASEENVGGDISAKSSEAAPVEGKSEDTVSSLTFTINEDDVAPPKKTSSTTIQIKAEISQSYLNEPGDNLKPDLITETDNQDLEPDELGEMVEIPLNEPEASSEGLPSSILKERKLESQEDINVISSVPEGINESRGARKWTLPLTTDLQESGSRGSAKNKDRDKNLSGNPSDIKKRKKDRKLTTRIRSFWLSAFGKSKSPVKNQEAS